MYLIITKEDADAIAKTLQDHTDPRLAAIRTRFEQDTGGDMEDIVAQLKKLEICAACNIEGQAKHCPILGANKLGRRLHRLVQRAKGES